MNSEEFKHWYESHTALFPNLHDWLKKKPNSIGILRQWESLLESVEHYEAMDASRRLYDRVEQPRSYEHHPREIKSIVRQKKNEAFRSRTGEVRTTNCKDCGDIGLACCIVYRDDGRTITNGEEVQMRALEDIAKRRPVRAYQCNFRCDCATWTENDYVGPIDRKRMILWDRSLMGKSMQTREFWETVTVPNASQF